MTPRQAFPSVPPILIAPGLLGLAQVCFGKPYAHFYVDDLAVDPLMTSQTVAKQTGYHTTYIKVRSPFGAPILRSRHHIYRVVFMSRKI